MSVTTYEGIVEGGRVRLLGAPRLAESTRVYIVVPENPAPAVRVRSPRLSDPKQISDFVMDVTNLEDASDAEL